MINGISSSSKHIVTYGTTSNKPYINSSYNTLLGIGNLRYNPSTVMFEVYDGNSWLPFPESITSIGITTQAESALDWVIQKMNEEKQIEELAKTSPVIQDLINQINEKKEQIKVVQTLLKEESKIA